MSRATQHAVEMTRTYRYTRGPLSQPEAPCTSATAHAIAQPAACRGAARTPRRANVTAAASAACAGLMETSEAHTPAGDHRRAVEIRPEAHVGADEPDQADVPDRGLPAEAETGLVERARPR